MSPFPLTDLTPDGSLQGRRILVAMSGGVDSSAAAALLQEAGAEVTGATFKNFCFSETDELPGRSCCSVDAVADALQVCRHLGLEHRLVDETERFGAEVIADFQQEYQAGRTPNPCARCNSRVRFPRLIEEADACGFDFVATGHYARIVSDEAGRFLARAADGQKDQSYFLAGMDPASFGRVIFPLGGLLKEETRALAKKAGLHIHEKRESQDVCFLAGRSLRDYLGGKGLLRPGAVLDPAGRKLGDHPGAALYTVGQRHGLGFGGGRPLYVTQVDAAAGTVSLGDESALYVTEILCRKAWLHPALGAAAELKGDGILAAKIRYRSAAHPVSALRLEDERLSVHFAEPVKAAAPGQSLVLYRDDRVVGFGVMESANRLSLT